jgi:uncharacterized membrane protein
MEYLTIKWLHIISATILFGTGLGSAFYKFITDKTNNIPAIAITNKNVVLADWIFTTPSIIMQPITGYLLISNSGYNLNNSWVFYSIILYLIAGLCWLPVVFLQIEMRNLSLTALKYNTTLPDKYWSYKKMWFYLGVPAFFSILGVFYLMTNKPILN